MITEEKIYDVLRIHKITKINVKNKVQLVNFMGYAMARINRPTMMHKLLKNGKLIDHINNNKLDNRKINLRVSDTTCNNHNTTKRQNTTSTYKGVSFIKKLNKYKTSITYKYYIVGFFDNEFDAAKAYNDKAKELYGELASINLIQ